MATIAELVANIVKIRKFVGIYLEVPELSPKQKNALKVDLVQLDRNLDALSDALKVSEAAVMRVAATEPAAVDPALFLDFEDDTVTYLFGGSPGNPDGVSFTYGQAKAWWADVIANGLNISNVRPALLPGSAVLSPEGLTLARDLALASDVFAPEDFNPLNLEIIP
jgi:hypothetical protein